MSKNKNIGGFISDDGFPLGVAYLLKILQQSDKFSGLNWFKSMFAKLATDLEKADQKESVMDDDNKDSLMYEDQKLDMEMSKRRIQKLKRDYEMLDFAFSASSILFKEI